MYRLLIVVLLASLGVALVVSGFGRLPLYTHRNAQESVDWVAEQFQDSQYREVKRAEIVDWTNFENQDAFIGVANYQGEAAEQLTSLVGFS